MVMRALRGGGNAPAQMPVQSANRDSPAVEPKPEQTGSEESKPQARQ
ncbi:MAG: hypothetical protein INR71_08450 [Terriglobus roseus]|nr:hypothetical protein [Terriglobus roseus]